MLHVCAPLGMPRAQGVGDGWVSGSRVLILSGLLQGLSWASLPAPSPGRTQGWPFRVCWGRDWMLRGLPKWRSEGALIQHVNSDHPFLVPATPTAVYGHSGQLSAPLLLWILYCLGVMALWPGLECGVLGIWMNLLTSSLPIPPLLTGCPRNM